MKNLAGLWIVLVLSFKAGAFLVDHGNDTEELTPQCENILDILKLIPPMSLAMITQKHYQRDAKFRHAVEYLNTSEFDTIIEQIDESSPYKSLLAEFEQADANVSEWEHIGNILGCLSHLSDWYSVTIEIPTEEPTMEIDSSETDLTTRQSYLNEEDSVETEANTEAVTQAYTSTVRTSITSTSRMTSVESKVLMTTTPPQSTTAVIADNQLPMQSSKMFDSLSRPSPVEFNLNLKLGNSPTPAPSYQAPMWPSMGPWSSPQSQFGFMPPPAWQPFATYIPNNYQSPYMTKNPSASFYDNRKPNGYDEGSQNNVKLSELTSILNENQRAISERLSADLKEHHSQDRSSSNSESSFKVNSHNSPDRHENEYQNSQREQYPSQHYSHSDQNEHLGSHQAAYHDLQRIDHSVIPPQYNPNIYGMNYGEPYHSVQQADIDAVPQWYYRDPYNSFERNPNQKVDSDWADDELKYPDYEDDSNTISHSEMNPSVASPVVIMIGAGAGQTINGDNKVLGSALNASPQVDSSISSISSMTGSGISASESGNEEPAVALRTVVPSIASSRSAFIENFDNPTVDIGLGSTEKISPEDSTIESLWAPSTLSEFAIDSSNTAVSITEDDATLSVSSHWQHAAGPSTGSETTTGNTNFETSTVQTVIDSTVFDIWTKTNENEFQDYESHTSTELRSVTSPSVTDTKLSNLSDRPDSPMAARSVQSFLVEIVNALPRTGLSDLIAQKCHNNPEFEKIYKVLRSRAFKLKAMRAVKSKSLQPLLGKLRQHNIDVRRVVQAVLKIFAMGPPAM